MPKQTVRIQDLPNDKKNNGGNMMESQKDFVKFMETMENGYDSPGPLVEMGHKLMLNTEKVSREDHKQSSPVKLSMLNENETRDGQRDSKMTSPDMFTTSIFTESMTALSPIHISSSKMTMKQQLLKTQRLTPTMPSSTPGSFFDIGNSPAFYHQHTPNTVWPSDFFPTEFQKSHQQFLPTAEPMFSAASQEQGSQMNHINYHANHENESTSRHVPESRIRKTQYANDTKPDRGSPKTPAKATDTEIVTPTTQKTSQVLMSSAEAKKQCKVNKRGVPTRGTTILTSDGALKGTWTDEEHSRFIEGLSRFSRGKWKEIAELVGTRTRVQVASHAQKYFRKIERRASILAKRAARKAAAEAKKKAKRASRSAQKKRTSVSTPSPSPPIPSQVIPIPPSIRSDDRSAYAYLGQFFSNRLSPALIRQSNHQNRSVPVHTSSMHMTDEEELNNFAFYHQHK